MAGNGKGKGKKISPSPPQSSSPPPLNPADEYIISFLNRIPASIRDQVEAVLSQEELEALVYMIKTPRKLCSRIDNIRGVAFFRCECLYCYQNYWSRWDSSPNSMIITNALDAFEQTLLSPDELLERAKTRSEGAVDEMPPLEDADDGVQSQAAPATPRIHHSKGNAAEEEPVKGAVDEMPPLEDAHGVESQAAPAMPRIDHKGFAWKFLPDLRGLFNSRNWKPWN